MNSPKKRSVGLCVLFSIITCGIYGLYWYVATTNDIQKSLQNPDGACRSGVLTILFSLITCGIYMLYWWFKQGGRVAQLQKERGIENPADYSIIHLLLMFVGVGVIVNMVLMQSELNKVAA